MKSLKQSSQRLRRIAAVLGLVAMLALGLLRAGAHAQEDDAPAKKGDGAGAAKAVVYLDKDRNAVVQIDRQSTSNDVSSMSMTGGTDLASGLSTVKAALEFNAESAAKMKGAKAAAFAQSDANATLMLANMNLPLRDKMEKAKFSGDAKAQQDDKNAHAEVKVSGTVPSDAGANPPVSKVTVDMQSKTDYKSLQASADVTVAATNLGMAPVKMLTISLADGDANSTTLDVALTVDLANPMMAQAKPQLEGMKANPKMFEGMVKSSLERYVKVDSVSLKVETTDKEGKVNLNIKATSLRDTIREKANALSAAMPKGEGNAETLKKAIEDMVSVTFTKFSIDAKIDNATLTAKLAIDAKNFDKFMAGYSTVMQTVQEAANKMQSENASDPTTKLAYKWWHTVQKRLNELSTIVSTEMAGAGVTMTQTLKVNVDVKEQVTFDGAFTQDTTNFDKVFANLKSKGLPLMENAALLAHIKADGGALTGSFYVATKGNLVQTLKALFVDPAKSEAELKPAADLLSALTWNDGRFQLSLNDNKLSYDGFMKTSDLTPIVSALQLVATPGLTGTLKGTRLEITGKDGHETKSYRLGFSSFMAGKSDDDIEKQIEPLFHVSDVSDKENADAKDVTLAKLEEPKVEMPGDLASVRSEGDSLLATAAPAPGASGGAASGGGPNKTVLIGIGIAILALLGIVMMSGKKQG